ncbi:MULTISPECIES: hypothetical protein [Luteibacter]|uniref:hypothetical protein n=1 Tax=Luteibacter TaxID=242605 RepID=UPI000559DDDF|nr:MULTISPECIES: hypothetical protein [unclassified Luteibacter]
MISFTTSNPQGLLAAMKKAIDQGHVTTWKYDSDGDFTHTPDQWRGKAWLRPKVVAGELQLGILFPRGHQATKEVYAVYHGRFIEMAMAHFDTSFGKAVGTALAMTPDVIAA